MDITSLTSKDLEPIENNTYLSGVDGVVDVEVGDIYKIEFDPTVKLKKWDNECNYSIRYNLQNASILSVDSKEIIYTDGDIKLGFYDKKNRASLIYPYEDGNGFEFDIILGKKPVSNKFYFSLNSKNVKFVYQPYLTIEEIQNGCYRADNINGSYAVYHIEDKMHNKYGIGKIGHIPRPLVVDALGNRIYADINITGDLLTLIVPEEFLGKATYPVIIDPVLGYDIAPGSIVDMGTTTVNVIVRAEPITSIRGSVVDLNFWYINANGNNIQMTLMSNEGGGIDITYYKDILQTAYPAFTPNVTSQTLKTLTLDSPFEMDSGDTIYMLLSVESATSKTITLYYDSIAGYTPKFFPQSPFEYDNWPIGLTFIYDLGTDMRMGFYLNYSPYLSSCNSVTTDSDIDLNIGYGLNGICDGVLTTSDIDYLRTHFKGMKTNFTSFIPRIAFTGNIPNITFTGKGD